MPHFDFAVDMKYTIWERTGFTVEADTLEEAKAKLCAMSAEERAQCVQESWAVFDDGYIYETAERMEPWENDGKHTQEWICIEDNDTLFTNVDKED